ncbi:hypothetical protein HDU99_000101 [Rhizoclosmatium hyalinum]|nr:hypothetical protein HDU99_000101 [Rhizoclosmatium hyalinum]
MDEWSNDINKGFGGAYVSLEPIWTSNAYEGCTGIRVWRSKNAQSGYTDMAKGTGGDYRYIEVTRSPGPKIVEIRLWRTSRGSKPSVSGYKYCDDLNQGRGGDDFEQELSKSANKKKTQARHNGVPNYHLSKNSLPKMKVSALVLFLSAAATVSAAAAPKKSHSKGDHHAPEHTGNWPKHPKPSDWTPDHHPKKSDWEPPHHPKKSDWDVPHKPKKSDVKKADAGPVKPPKKTDDDKVKEPKKSHGPKPPKKSDAKPPKKPDAKPSKKADDDGDSHEKPPKKSDEKENHPHPKKTGSHKN